ncbi:MAG: hypothetical protein KatS3mg016_2164 [Fimbriimonadales bacterium]|nr:MAG: hypothetical protein KatS3mg016_2164 [Fimbriimonadales bacterium]
MAFLSLNIARWHDRLQAWWEEYYLDNPLVWALQQGAVHHLRDRMQISNLRVLPLWTRKRMRWAIFWWTVALLGVCGVYWVPTLSQQASQWLWGQLPQGVAYFSLWFFFAARSNSMVELMNALHKANHLTAVGMTRLCGAHVVYGGVLHSWANGTLMRTLIAYYPLLWLVHTVVGGSALAALFTAAAGMLVWNTIMVILLLISFSTLPVVLPVREAGAGKADSRFENAFSFAQIAALLLVPGGLVVIFLMVKVYILAPSILGVWLLVMLLFRLAVRRADRMLRSKEPEIVPSEGRWQ